MTPLSAPQSIRVSWVFDVISPFAYLAFPRLEELPAGVELEVVPVLLAALLDHFGQRGPAEIPSKRRFTYRFVLWRARRLGLPLRMPPAHPFNPLAALRLIIAAGSTSLAAQLSVADPQAAIADPAIKQRLRDNTSWACSRGVFGVPTLLIGEELFWGHDAIDMALDYLRQPQAFADPDMRSVDSLPIAAARTRTQAG